MTIATPNKRLPLTGRREPQSTRCPIFYIVRKVSKKTDCPNSESLHITYYAPENIDSIYPPKLKWEQREGGLSLFQFNDRQYACPFDCFVAILKGKWRTNILLLLAQKPQRFAQLQKHIEGISAKVLSENLHLMEKNYILHREVFPTIPPTVEYSLTEKGRALINIMSAINAWSNVYLHENTVQKNEKLSF